MRPNAVPHQDPAYFGSLILVLIDANAGLIKHRNDAVGTCQPYILCSSS